MRHLARTHIARGRSLLRPSADDGRDRAGRLTRDIAAEGVRAIARPCSTKSRGVFPRLIELYDNTASLQDRTVDTGIVKPELGAPIRGRRLYRPRVRPRLRCSARASPIAPYDELRFEVPVLDEGDVNARVWIRIREVEQSLSADRANPWRDLPEGAIKATHRRERRLRGTGIAPKLFAATFWCGSGSTPKAGCRAAICAMRPGSNGRCWKLRSRAISSPTSRSATNHSTAPTRDTTSRRCAKHCSKVLSRTLTEPAPTPTRTALADLAQNVNRSARATARPFAIHPPGRCRLLQRL